MGGDCSRILLLRCCEQLFPCVLIEQRLTKYVFCPGETLMSLFSTNVEAIARIIVTTSLAVPTETACVCVPVSPAAVLDDTTR